MGERMTELVTISYMGFVVRPASFDPRLRRALSLPTNRMMMYSKSNRYRSLNLQVDMSVEVFF